MKGWRPEGWKNPHQGLPTDEIFEAGADALLEALKKRSAFLSSKELESIIIHNAPRNGYLILIPEDEDMHDATFNAHEQQLCDKWNAQHPVGTKVIFADYWGKKHTGTTDEPAKIVYGKAVVYLKEPTLAARYELERIQATENEGEG